MPSPPARQQRTLAGVAHVEGFGYWSGADVTVEFQPAPVDAGVTFVRRDLRGAPRIPAFIALRTDAPRRTNLVCGPARVEMVEHVLAALSGLGIDNCDVCVDQPEMPGCDGSAAAFVAALDAVGVAEQSALVRQLVVDRPVRFGNDQHWIEAQPSSGSGLSVEFVLDYGQETAIGRQSFAVEVTPENFRRELATSRTFLLEEEANSLAALGLGARVTTADLLIFGEAGPIDNVLRFEDECARHKTLDVVGDLALAGCEIIGHVVAYRSGHQLNADLVRALLQHAGWEDSDLARCA